MTSNEKVSDKILQLSFRSHHNAYKNGDGSGAEIYNLSTQPTASWYKWSQILYGFLVFHYFLWFIPLFLAFWLPYWLGYPLISGILIGWYTVTYFKTDELGLGRHWELFRSNRLWKLLQHYIEFEIIREVPLDPTRKYIFAHHPHGILILTRIASYGGVFEKLFPGVEVRALGASPMFYFPGSREVCMWLGAVRADKFVGVNLLRTKNPNLSIYVFPGGIDEMLETEKDSNETVIISRKGFIRLALEEGADIVPSFGFGEKDAYHKFTIPKFVTNFILKNFKLPILIFWGKFFTLLPLKGGKGLSVVYGQPIRIEKPVTHPSDELVNEIYVKYYDEIKNLFGKYKIKYGYDKSEKLIIKEARLKTKSTQNVSAQHVKEN